MTHDDEPTVAGNASAVPSEPDPVTGDTPPSGRRPLAMTGVSWAAALLLLVAGLVTGSVRLITLASAVGACGLIPLLYWRGVLIRHHAEALGGSSRRRQPS